MECLKFQLEIIYKRIDGEWQRHGFTFHIGVNEGKVWQNILGIQTGNMTKVVENQSYSRRLSCFCTTKHPEGTP